MDAEPSAQVSWQARDVEREELEVDVLIVGAGPSALACAIALKRELGRRGLDRSILVLEKSEELGYHILSGAVMDPRGMEELFPDWRERGCPIESEVRFDAFDVLWKSGRRTRFTPPFVPPPMDNHGNTIISLYRVVRWLAEEAGKLGVDIYPGFAGAEVLYDGPRVVGVQTRDAGIHKSGARKGTFQAGMNIKAAVTVFAEGTRGSLAKDLKQRLGLSNPEHPETYGTGIKELWELPPERGKELRGHVYHSMGMPLGLRGYGGGWIYGLAANRLSIGFVVGLDHPDPKLDPHALFVQWKQHPGVAEYLRGGKVVRYGAKTVPYGGYWSMPKLYGDGFVLTGDTAAFLNSARLKGVHLALKSGMLAAEAIAEALAAGDTSAAKLARYHELFRVSWAKDELWQVRNFHQAFDRGLFAGMLDAGLQMVTGGRGAVERRGSHADHTTTRRASEGRLTKPAFDGQASMDKLTDVYWSGTQHEEDQPPHLVLRDPKICVERCTEEFGNPCQHFCPAAVYEWPKEAQPTGVLINAANCVHCKTCDIADPYQIIEWVVPEGGGGPKYVDM